MYCKNTSVLLFYCHAHARPRKTTSPTRHMNAFLISLATPLANAITSKPLLKFIKTQRREDAKKNSASLHLKRGKTTFSCRNRVFFQNIYVFLHPTVYYGIKLTP